VTWIKLYGLTAAVFFAIDLVWLGVIASSFYERYLGHLLRENVLWIPALIFYGIYIAGILVFAVLPALEAGSVGRAAAAGAFLGFFAYATFDLTCMALFRSFPLVVVLVDLTWGTLLTGGVSAAAFGLARWLQIG